MVRLVIACGIRGIRRMQSNAYAEMQMIRLSEQWYQKKKTKKGDAISLLREIESSPTESLPTDSWL